MNRRTTTTQLYVTAFVILVACIPSAQAATYDIDWTGANGWSLEGQFSFLDSLVGTGPIDESQIDSFAIDVLLNDVSQAQYAGPVGNFNFDTTTEQFLVGGSGSSSMGQLWNDEGIQGPGAGFASGLGIQVVTIDGMLQSDSEIATSASTLTATRVIPPPQAVTLTDEGDVYEIPAGGITADVFSVDGVDLLQQRSFFYRVGGVGPEREVNFTNLDLDSESITDSDSDGDDNQYSVTLSDPGGSFSMVYTVDLIGDPFSGGMALTEESIRITNETGDDLDFSFFIYNDFDLSAGNDDASVVVSPFDGVSQVGGPFEVLAVINAPDVTQVGSSADGILTALTDGDTDNLTPAGSVTGVDAVFAFQYDVTIAPGERFTLNTSIDVIPEPSSLMLLGLGGLALTVRWRQGIQ